MEDSILKSTKKMLGLDDSYTAFDYDVCTQINSAFSTLYQLGVGLGAPIDDDSALWSELGLPVTQLNMVKTLIFLKVRMGFDPPGTSYLIDAAEKQIAEQEARLIMAVELESLHET